MTFYEAFRANMQALGLPAPRSLFESTTTATATIAALSRAITQFGSKATLREVVLTIPVFISAKAAIDLTIFTGGITAAYYFGACIGSLLVATGQTVSVSSLVTSAEQARVGGMLPIMTRIAARVR